MKVVIPGGSGQVGAILARAFHLDGHEVVVLTRRPETTALRSMRSVKWDGASLGDWVCELDGADVVVNLAGKNVNCRYSAANRREILRSRVDSTRAIGKAILAARRPPAVWLQASTATIYAHRYDAPNDERTGRVGGPDASPNSWHFSIKVAKAWEHELESAEVPGTRKVALRSAMTMSPDSGGVFDTLLGLVRRGLGGRAGDGRQYVSWIHELDFVNAVKWLIENDLEGAVNLAAPQPLPNADFMKAIREAARISFGLPASRWMLEVGAFFMRTETELILKSRRVVPGRLAKDGFAFKFPSWPEAAEDLCAQWRRQQRGRLE